MTVWRGSGVVLASYGRGVLVQTGTEILHGTLKGRKQRVVCGDRVALARDGCAQAPSVESVEPRVNLLERIDARGRPEPVAANIDRLAIVSAPEPAPDWYLVDRYWAGARLIDIEAVVIVNKSDLGTASIAPALDTYRALGLPCLELSARSGAGIEAFRRAFTKGVTLFVGQSGVGKSSLINVLVPQAAAQTAELDARRRGQAHHHHGAALPSGSGSRDGRGRCAGRTRLRAAREPRARGRARFRRDPRSERRLPFQRLQAPRGARLRGTRGGGRGTHRCAALRKLPAAVPPVREARPLRIAARGTAAVRGGLQANVPATMRPILA